MTASINAKPFDRSELAPCAGCGKGLLHDNHIHFYEVMVTQCIADVTSIREQHGLEVLLGGNAGLAAVFAPSTNVAHRLPHVRRLFCAACALESHHLAAMAEGE